MMKLANSLPLRGGALDYGLAAFAAFAFAFAAFVMPEWRLNQAIGLTGLPELLSTAQPPLGLKARLGFALGVGFLVCGGVFALMRLLDRVPAATGHAADEPIRLRRADAHPDAPARRPLIAGRDLGEPVEELLLVAPEEPLFEEPEAEPEPLEELVLAVEDEPAELVAEPIGEEPGDLVAEPVSEPVLAASEEPQPAAAEDEPREESLSLLMRRLEFGLAKRERATADPAAVAPRAEDAVGHRLRSAITDLQKLAAQG
jgi:hypothetical protein